MEPGVYSGVYVGKEICGFKKEHKYQFEIRHNGRTYQLHAINDLNENNEADLYMDYSNEISIKKYWIIDEEVDNNE